MRKFPSRLWLLVAATLLFSFACSRQSGNESQAATASSSDTLVLRGFTLIDGKGGTPLANAALIAQDGHITWVGAASDLKAPAGVSVRDLAGKFVTPGIINLHGHVAESDGITQDPKALFTRENVESNLRLYAQYGITSVMSMGTDQPIVYEIREEQRKGRPAVARIFTAGRGFTAKGGYPGFPGGIPGVPYEVQNAKDGSSAVDELATHHPDLVKIWVDDHFGVLPKIPIELSRPIIEAAHRNNLKAAAHVFYLSDAKELSSAGIDGLAHSVRDKAVDDELITHMKQYGTWLMAATLAREAAMFAFSKPEEFLKDPLFTRATPAKVQSTIESPAYQKRLVSDPHYKDYPRYLKTAQQNLKRLADAGIRFGFGTDTGPPFRSAGFGEHWEMQLMVEAGLTPMQVLTAATSSAAEFLGAKDLGTLENGKWADLVVVNANPLESITNMRQIDSVYVAGNKVE
ncbi:MAG: amidohydrolase family protein [Candidatus Korobacteraceae bacterium]